MPNLNISLAPDRAAVEKFGARKATPSSMTSAEWARVAPAIREKCFFSARVNDAETLGKMRELIGKAVDTSKRNPNEALVSQEKFISEMKSYLRGRGYAVDGTALTDIASRRRLSLIYKMNYDEAREFAKYTRGQDSDALYMFPAQEFLRVEPRRVPRTDWQTRWRAAGGKIYGGRMVALKSSDVWKNLSRFDRPYSDNKEVRAARLAYIKENAADFLREFNAWAGTNAAKFYGFEEPNSQMTEAQKAEAAEMRKFFYAVYWVLTPDCPANTGLRLVPQLYIKNAEGVNPTYYRDLKAAGFEIDGVKLPAVVQIQVAAICGDLDYFAALDWKNVDGGGLFAAAHFAKKMLVAADDVERAAAVCAEYKRALVLNGAATDSPTLAEIKTAEMFLNEAILNKQIRAK